MTRQILNAALIAYLIDGERGWDNE